MDNKTGKKEMLICHKAILPDQFNIDNLNHHINITFSDDLGHLDNHFDAFAIRTGIKPVNNEEGKSGEGIKVELSFDDTDDQCRFIYTTFPYLPRKGDLISFDELDPDGKFSGVDEIRVTYVLFDPPSARIRVHGISRLIKMPPVKNCRVMERPGYAESSYY